MSSQAAPLLTYDADFVQVTYGHVDTFLISGPGFSFQGSNLGENIPGGGVLLHPGDMLEAVVFVPETPAPLQGSISVGGIGMDALIQGIATTPVRYGTVPVVTAPTVFSVPLTISGTFSACLQVAGASPFRPCDPNFLNYATINVSLPGQYEFSLEPSSYSPYYSVSAVAETYVASAASTPEPGTFWLLAGALLAISSGISVSRKSIVS